MLYCNVVHVTEKYDLLVTEKCFFYVMDPFGKAPWVDASRLSILGGFSDSNFKRVNDLLLGYILCIIKL